MSAMTLSNKVCPWDQFVNLEDVQQKVTELDHDSNHRPFPLIYIHDLHQWNAF